MSILNSRTPRQSGCFILTCLVISVTCSFEKSYAAQIAGPPLGLPPLAASQTQPVTKEEIALGKKLFFDQRLSADGTVSCSSCHDPNRYFSDGRAQAVGVSQRQGTRNAPSLLNVGYQTTLFWDGRVSDLQSQASAPLINQSEHGLAGEQQLLRLIGQEKEYEGAFAKAFPTQKSIAIGNVTQAIVAYEHTLLSGDSPFDRYYYRGEKNAISASAIRGLDLFKGQGRCSTCHTIDKDYALFTDQKFHSSTMRLPPDVTASLPHLTQAVTQAKANPDQRVLDQMITDNPQIAALGRFNVTLEPADIGMFRTPSLRNVAKTAPYMHDGSVDSLEQTVEAELYVRGDAANYPIVLTEDERKDLLAFLQTLTGPPVDY